MSDIAFKICGIQTVAEAKLVVDCQIDYVGLNFIPSSKRYISLSAAVNIMSVLQNSSVKTVALFKNQPLELIKSITNQLAFDYIQLNGAENSDFVSSLSIPVIRSIAVKPSADADALAAYIKTYPADIFILDRSIQGEGEPVDMQLARKLIKSTKKQLFLAGGITPDNCKDVLKVVCPFGIDIAGGVRTNGVLDALKIQNIKAILKNV